MKLPNLYKYRLSYIQKNVSYPLKTVPVPTDGLLKYLPNVPVNKTGWPWNEQTKPGVYEKRTFWPKLTIVTPSFNQGSFLEETIRSVLLQNYPNLEYIIIDGGSTDNSKEIIQRYSHCVSYYQSEKDDGQGQAINLGFSLGSGEYFAWINSDDYYLENVFKTIIEKFLESKTEFIYGYGYNFESTAKRFELVKVLPFKDFFIKIPSLIQPSTFWKSTINQPIWEDLHCSLDFELWMRMVKGNRRALIKEPLSVANVHDEAKTINPKMKSKWDEDEKRIWSNEGHGPVPHWHKIHLLNRLRFRIYKILNLI